jgi:hypothetical protein
VGSEMCIRDRERCNTRQEARGWRASRNKQAVNDQHIKDIRQGER